MASAGLVLSSEVVVLLQPAKMPLGFHYRRTEMTEHEATSTATVAESGTPEERIVYFDGVCGLCNRFVDFLLTQDTRDRLRFAPLQGETARQNLPQKLTENLKTVAFVEGGRFWTHSAAVVRIFWRLGPVWRMTGTLLWLIPRPLRDAGYRLIAARRYRLFGQRETCRLPTEAERARFLP
jgi:predicted DCC family thiol-disulfide oxidoreductase YuxK